MTTNAPNTFESRVGDLTVGGRAHSLSVWFVLALRLVIGFAFLWSGLDKVLSGSFSAAGYLTNVAATNGNPLAGLFLWMGQTPWFVEFVNVAAPFGELAIGLCVMVGLLTRLAAFSGALMMLLFYFGNWDVAHGVINSDFMYMLVFLSVAAFGAGRILGFDAFVEATKSTGRCARRS